MLDRKKMLSAWLVIGAIGIATASCSGSNSQSNGFDGSPATLISKCDQICNNVVASCAASAGLPYNACLSACNDLGLVPQSCLNPFASYLICLAGATSVTVTCGANGGRGAHHAAGLRARPGGDVDLQCLAGSRGRVHRPAGKRLVRGAAHRRRAQPGVLRRRSERLRTA